MVWTDLHSAAFEGDAERVRELLKKGADPNTQDKYGWTPLHDAAREGRVDVVKLLLEHGADPNVKNKDGNTLLHWTADEGRVEVARLLLEHGVDPNTQDKDGETPLHLAAFWGHVEVARLLLEHGANPTVKNKDGKTPLDLAREEGYDGVVSLIEEWLGRGGGPSRPGAAPVRSASVAVCEAVCEAWRIIDQVYGFVKEARAMTAKELENLKDLFHVFKGHVEALEAMTARPDAVEELRSFRDYVELLLPHLERGDLDAVAKTKITSMRDRFNKLREELACRC